MSHGIERHFKVVGGKDAGDQMPPNQDAVEILEEALELAKRGEIQSVLLVGLTNRAVMANGWSSTASTFAMLGALTQTVTDYQNRELIQYRPDHHDGMP